MEATIIACPNCRKRNRVPAAVDRPAVRGGDLLHRVGHVGGDPGWDGLLALLLGPATRATMRIGVAMPTRIAAKATLALNADPNTRRFLVIPERS